MLALARDSDSVELKLTVPEEQHRSTILALGMDPLGAQIRLVSFFDTPALDLNQLNLTPEEFGRKMVAELWLYPGGERILELSTKCPPGEMFQVAAEARAFLEGRGIELSGAQQTKTATALKYFASHLDA